MVSRTVVLSTGTVGPCHVLEYYRYILATRELGHIMQQEVHQPIAGMTLPLTIVGYLLYPLVYAAISIGANYERVGGLDKSFTTEVL